MPPRHEIRPVEPPTALARLLGIVRRLRAPDGCPWDREQTEQSMAPHLLEEAFEAADAIRSGDAQASAEELGDVLMNVLMVSQIASEADRFGLEDVCEAIADKLVRRHPHVFGEEAEREGLEQPDAVLANWERIKQTERDSTVVDPERRSALAGVPAALPALLRAYRVGEKAARVGFDWPDVEGPRAKIDEELGELDAAASSGTTADVEHELGDVLFSVVNYSRHLGHNPEIALRATIDRFTARFQSVERQLGDGLADASIETMEAAWQRAKAEPANGADGTPEPEPT